MTPRENFFAIYNREQPDAYIDAMSALEILPDPILMGDMVPQDGKEHPDSWGVTYCFKPGAPGQHPVINDSNVVIKDIEHWKDYVHFPPTKGLDWTVARQVEAGVDRREKLVAIMFGGGLFERSHFLMGMENALINYLEYPDEMKDLLSHVKDWKISYIEEMAKEVRPDIIFYHDDWGSKQNVFLPPDVWRDIIKPLQCEIAEAIHANGMIYMHHADCICQPIVNDMVDIGIDIWQGVIAQNDIVAIQEVTGGRLAMCGGIDGPKVDLIGISEEEIRAEVHRAFDTYLPRGRFYPGIPNGVCFNEWNNSIIQDEIIRYGIEYAQKERTGK